VGLVVTVKERCGLITSFGANVLHGAISSTLLSMPHEETLTIEH